MKVREIYPGLYLYLFKNQFELCHSFFRLQEFYESPIKKLRGNYFSYEEAITAYAYYDKKKPEFTYLKDWAGFNVPGSVVLNFNILFQDITKKEEAMLGKIDYFKAENFYILGAVKGEKDVMQHETAHGLYYLNKEFKKEMNALLKQIPKAMKKQIKKYLLSKGYCRQVIQDESQAYLATGFKWRMISTFNHVFHQFYIRKFRKVFLKYYKRVKK